MCGRFTQRHKPEEVAERFEVEPIDLLETARYNIAPSQPIAAIRQVEAGRELFAPKWGLIPFWAKDPSIGNNMINAKSETLAEKPSFKRAFAKRRCLIPADGFYEWRKKGKGPSQPFYIHLKDDGLFAFAGLWEEWKSPEGEVVVTCTIITIDPNELVAGIHNRMPVILRRENEAAWLDPKNDISTAAGLMQTYPGELMDAYQISRAVNNPRFDDQSCIEPVTSSDDAP
ncbi:MAG: SOS response-associated peptidase [Acidobacteriota bacterium]|nr:MAG: SOS response-associated peptidase [Acidobacteriota bacterium]